MLQCVFIDGLISWGNMMVGFCSRCECVLAFDYSGMCPILVVLVPAKLVCEPSDVKQSLLPYVVLPVC